MAKQAGINFITGCIDNICFYKMNGQYYARRKSSLDRKRVKTGSRFKQTMRYAGIFGIASKLASQVYGELTAAEKQKGLFRYLTGRAFGFLKEGVFKEDVLFLLRTELGHAATGNRIHSNEVCEDGIDREECSLHEFTEQELNGKCLTTHACKYHSAISLENVMYTVQQTEGVRLVTSYAHVAFSGASVPQDHLLPFNVAPIVSGSSTAPIPNTYTKNKTTPVQSSITPFH